MGARGGEAVLAAREGAGVSLGWAVCGPRRGPPQGLTALRAHSQEQGQRPDRAVHPVICPPPPAARAWGVPERLLVAEMKEYVRCLQSDQRVLSPLEDVAL